VAWGWGAEPSVVISKVDLAEDPDELEAEAESIAIGARCFLVCAPEGRGLEALRRSLGAGRTVVLLGSSGAGKSTLLNALAGGELARTNAVRADDQRGRHTTTSRQLYRLPSGGMVIDTPGLRELQLWADEESVMAAFPDIEALAAACRFRDCSHEAEPGCAVRAAIGTGALDPERYESWRKLSREAAFLRTRIDPEARREEERKWKVINKSMRGYSKERRALQGRAR
jgi:ribosome biogenesis GTPase / thiamine phosphate phosphatase